MGHNPSADLFYGYDLVLDGEDFEDLRPQWWQDGEEWEEVLARKLGWVEVPYPDFSKVDWDDRHKTPEYKAWSESRDALHALTRRIDVEIDSYGYMEEPTYALRVKDSPARRLDQVLGVAGVGVRLEASDRVADRGEVRTGLGNEGDLHATCLHVLRVMTLWIQTPLTP